MSPKHFEDNIIPDKPTIQYHEFPCYQCHFPNRFIKPESFIDWKKEFEIMRSMKNSIIHDLNESIAYAELNYGLNPNKDRLIDALTKIREKYS